MATSGQGESHLKIMYFSAQPLNRACGAQNSCSHQPFRLTGYKNPALHISLSWGEKGEDNPSRHEDIDL